MPEKGSSGERKGSPIKLVPIKQNSTRFRQPKGRFENISSWLIGVRTFPQSQRNAISLAHRSNYRYQSGTRVQMEDDPLFRRIRQHAELRLDFRATQSTKARLEQIKEFMRLEKEMLQRYHQKATRTSSRGLDRSFWTLLFKIFQLRRLEESAATKPMCILATGGRCIAHTATSTRCSFPPSTMANHWNS